VPDGHTVQTGTDTWAEFAELQLPSASLLAVRT